MPRLWFLIPGDLATPTGGYHYDRRVIAGLRVLGWDLRVVPLNASFPLPTQAALDEAEQRLSEIPDGEGVVVDGLAFGCMAASAARHGERLSLIALVHHPLALETGIGSMQHAHDRDEERKALAASRGVIATSASTARLLVSDYAVPRARIRVVEPGCASAPLATGSARGSVTRILCVGALTPRKGHDLLLHALAPLRDRSWHLDCVGCRERSPETARRLLQLSEHLGLRERVVFTGAVDESTLDAYYQGADLFVLATRYEGYGMVLTEALARGLPILSTRVGAVPDVVPTSAGRLVPPDDPGALGRMLARLLDDQAFRGELATGARHARSKLRDWDWTSVQFAAALTELGSLSDATIP